MKEEFWVICLWLDGRFRGVAGVFANKANAMASLLNAGYFSPHPELDIYARKEQWHELEENVKKYSGEKQWQGWDWVEWFKEGIFFEDFENFILLQDTTFAEFDGDFVEDAKIYLKQNKEEQLKSMLHFAEQLKEAGQ